MIVRATKETMALWRKDSREGEIKESLDPGPLASGNCPCCGK